MKLLALDTATELCSAALWLEGIVSSREALAPRAQGALILPMIDELLREAQLSPRALDAIAFGRGPGAFTGVRLAAAIAQGLGFSLDLPLIGISDLRALAAQALAGADSARALICQDARMEEVYWGCFERAGHTVRPVGEEAVTAPAAVRLPDSWPRDATLIAAGSGLAVYADRLPPEARSGRILPQLRPRALEVAALAAADGLASSIAPESALPVYLRDRVTAGS